jgi:thiol-disulfide isomerase/thioredoxin
LGDDDLVKVILMSYRSLILAVAWLAASVATSHAETPTKPIRADAFKEVLAKERGQIVILNLWATWCVPCLREIPDLIAVTDEVSKSGVVLIGVAVDDPSPNAAEVERFRKKYFPKFLTYARQSAEMDELASVVDPAWNEVVPTTYLIDRNGKVVSRIQGKKSAEEFRVAIRKLL